MPNSFKNTWWIFLLIAAGGILFFLSLRPNKLPGDQGMVLNDMATGTPPVNGHEAGFTIQVYSFQNRNRAQSALQALKNRGYQATLLMSDLGKKGVWWRVSIGGIEDEATARKMLDEIRKNYNSGFILKPKN